MTIEQFMINNRITNKKKVYEWIKKELIPGADLEKKTVPDSARVPYTKARARTARSIYISILRATKNKYHVMPELYKICQDEFNVYISQLVDAGLIIIRNTDGITYYDASLKCLKCNENLIFQLIESVTKAISQGVAEATYNNLISA